jgi:hypothetical protein
MLIECLQEAGLTGPAQSWRIEKMYPACAETCGLKSLHIDDVLNELARIVRNGRWTMPKEDGEIERPRYYEIPERAAEVITMPRRRQASYPET